MAKSNFLAFLKQGIAQLYQGRYPIPPDNLVRRGSCNFERTGKEFFRYFTELGNLSKKESVLDVGCGSGRMAVPLTNYLSKEASYYGFDIMTDSIHWCQKNISRKHPNFHFIRVDVFNKRYNPAGKVPASNFIFPYQNDSFGFVFLTSVFTHMLPDDMEHYLSEIVRVSKPGSRSLITFFLLNRDSIELLNDKKSTLDFQYVRNGYRTINDDEPEAAIAYDEEYVRSLYTKYGLRIVEPIHYGNWCGRTNFLSYQDIIVAVKTGTR